MARPQLNEQPLALSDADLENVARVAERLLTGRPLTRSGSLPHRRRVGTGLEFFDYREYVPGDELRHVDWRASARARALQLRRYREESSSQWMICLDRSASMGTRDAEKWRLGAEIAAALCYVLLALNCRVGLIAFSSGVDALCPPGRGQRHYASVLATIVGHSAATHGGASALADCLAVIRKDSGLVVISDFLRRDSMRPDLALLSRRCGGLHALRIASEADRAGPAAGPLTLRDAETGRQRAVVCDPAANESVCRAWDRQSEDWAATCRSLSIHASTAWTGRSWKEALLDHLTTAGTRRA